MTGGTYAAVDRTVEDTAHHAAVAHSSSMLAPVTDPCPRLAFRNFAAYAVVASAWVAVAEYGYWLSLRGSRPGSHRRHHSHCRSRALERSDMPSIEVSVLMWY